MGFCIRESRGSLRAMTVAAVAILMAMFALIIAPPPSAWASTGDKTLTVDAAAIGEDESVYTTIQDAINFIDAQNDKENWTITVKGGNYSRFTVLNGLNGLTVQAANGANVIVSTVNSSDAPVATSGGFPDTGGVSIREANDVTLEGLTFTVGTQTNPWYVAAVSNYTESGVRGNNLSVIGCTFAGSGSASGVFINTGTTQFSVQNCSFSNLKEAVSMYGDGTLMSGASVTSNTFEGCSFALHGYYGGTGDAGVLTFANNTVIGGDVLRCKVVVQDQTNTGALKADVRGNQLTNAVVGLVNLREAGETVSDVLNSNTFGMGSFYVEAEEPGTIDFYTAYQVPQGSQGGWALTGVDDFDVDWGTNPDGSTAYIGELVANANAEGSNVLNITGIDPDNLIKTFTWFKDGIYWVSYPQAGNLTVSKTVEGENAEPDQEFEFTIELSDTSVNGVFGDLTFVDGVATFTLCDGENVTATGLPACTLVDGATNTELAPVAYTVTEAETEGYEVTIPETANGVLAEGGFVQVDFVNTPTAVPVDPTPAPADPTDPGEDSIAIEKVDMRDPAARPAPTTKLPATGDSPIAPLVGCLLIVAGTGVLMARRASLHR
ncbi:DUF7601 domain-containing protein [Eggerthella lenta]|uniref:DUF7601 domain-containing protein n=1 Tax=Eggerthella lenta TaxID=84112 RepID=UPI001F24308A|nr:hypothetical protein [Eggerthella lenta]